MLYSVLKTALLSIPLAFILGCSDKEGSNPDKVTGVFVDAAVSGLNYSCSSGDSSLTDNLGTFTCTNGDTVSFSLGDIPLGEVAVSETITPLTLFPSNPEAALNVAQLLQSVDSDGDPSNGITPDSAAVEHIVSTIGTANLDFEATNFDTLLAAALPAGSSLVDETTARTHLQDSLTELGIDADTTPPSFTSTSTFNAAENQIAVGTVTTNDTTATLSLSGTDASYFNLASDGTLTFKNAPDYEVKNSYSISVSAKDSAGNSANQMITINLIDILETSPTLNNATFTVEEGKSQGYIIGSVPIISTGGDAISQFTLLNTLHSDHFNIDTNGQITISNVADMNYTYEDIYNLQVTCKNSYGTSNTANITITVQTKPVATLTTLTLNEDTPKSDVAMSATDTDGGTLSYSITANPSHGNISSVNSATGAFTYTPTANYYGSDSFTYSVTDGIFIISQNVAVTINGVNDAPTATTQALSTDEDTPITGVLGATDIDPSDTLTFSVISSTSGCSADISHGTFLLDTNGTYTYTPDANYYGTDGFCYKVQDDSGTSTSDSNLQEVTITIASINDAPVATTSTINLVNDSYSGTLEATDAEFDTLSYEVVTSPTKVSSFLLNSDGSISFDKGTIGTNDSFSYKVYDGNSYSAEKTVSIVVNNPPYFNSSNFITVFSKNKTISDVDSNELYHNVAFGKINADNTVDAVSCDGTALNLYTSDATLNFTKTQITTDITSCQVFIEDFNKDGHNDILVLSDGAITLFTNDANTNLVSSNILTNAALSFTNSRVKIADVDGDYNKDIVVSYNGASEAIDVLINNYPNNTFVTHTVDSALNNANTMSVANFDGTNGNDLVYPAYNTTSNSYDLIQALNDGSENFSTSTILSGLPEIYDIQSEHIVGDLSRDIIVAGLNQLFILEKNSGSWVRHDISTLSAHSIILYDVDGKNGKDIIMASKNNSIVAFLNQGDGSFVKQLLVGNSLGAEFVQFIDINNDYKDELFVPATKTGVAVHSTMYNKTKGFLIDEGATAIGTADATDVEGETLTYSISGGADAGLVAINSATGALALTTPIDFETPVDDNNDSVLELEVSVTDGVSTTPQSLAIGINDLKRFAFDSSHHGKSYVVVSDSNYEDARAVDLTGNGKKEFVLFGSKKFSTVKELTYMFKSSSGYTNATIDSTYTKFKYVQTGDFDNDGDIDIVAAAYDTSNSVDKLVLYTNDGGGTFIKSDIATQAIQSIEVGYSDADSNLDIIVSSNKDVIAYYGNGAGGFTPTTLLTTSASAVNNAILVDLDADGDKDIVIDTGRPQYILQTADKTFASEVNFTYYYNAYGANIFAMDINGDSYMDILAGDKDASSIYDTLLINDIILATNSNSNDKFSVNQLSNYLKNDSDYAVGDLDGDGDDDFAKTTTQHEIVWMKNDGSGNFTRHVISTEYDFKGVLIEDINNDGLLDIVGISNENANYGSVVIFLQNTAATD